MKISKIVKNLKKIGVKEIENKDWLAKNKLSLFEFIKSRPASATPNHYILEKTRFGILKFKPIAVVAGILIAVLLAGGGTAFASQNSLPGDTLYPVKLATEDVQTALSFNPAKKVKLEGRFANRRLEEIKKLQEKIKKKNGELSQEIIEKAMGRAGERLEKAEGRIDEMEGGKLKYLALEAASHLEEALNTHQQILSELAEEVPTPAQGAILRAQEVSARGAERALEAILRFEKAKELAPEIREKIGERRILGAKERAEGKLKALEGRWEALNKYVEHLEELNTEAETKKMNEAKEKIDEASNFIEEEKYLEAFKSGHHAMRLMMEVKLLLRPTLAPILRPTPQPTETAPTPMPVEPILQPVPVNEGAISPQQEPILVEPQQAEPVELNIKKY